MSLKLARASLRDTVRVARRQSAQATPAAKPESLPKPPTRLPVTAPPGFALPEQHGWLFGRL